MQIDVAILEDIKIIISAVSGAAVWEAIKFFFPHLWKTRQDKKNQTNTLFREDLSALKGQVLPLQTLALAYYGKPSVGSEDLSRQIKISMNNFGMAWNDVNKRLQATGRSPLARQSLIKFRQGLTTHLDISRVAAEPISSGLTRQIFFSSSSVLDEISRIRHTLI